MTEATASGAPPFAFFAPWRLNSGFAAQPALPPIPDRRLDEGQGADRRGVGAQDAWAEADGGHEGQGAEALALFGREAALRADQHGRPGEGRLQRLQCWLRLATLVAEDQ